MMYALYTVCVHVQIVRAEKVIMSIFFCNPFELRNMRRLKFYKLNCAVCTMSKSM